MLLILDTCAPSRLFTSHGESSIPDEVLDQAEPGFELDVVQRYAVKKGLITQDEHLPLLRVA